MIYVIYYFRSLPFGRRDSTISSTVGAATGARTKRRESSADVLKGKLGRKASVDTSLSMMKPRRGSISTTTQISTQATFKRIVTSPGKLKISIKLHVHF